MEITVRNCSSKDITVSINQWGKNGTTSGRRLEPGTHRSWERSDRRGFVMFVSRSNSEDETYFVEVGELYVITDDEVKILHDLGSGPQLLIIELTKKKAEWNLSQESLSTKTDCVIKDDFGAVWIGQLNETVVAIKEFHLQRAPHLLSIGIIDLEFDPYYRITHKHIIQFYGICTESAKFKIVTEFIPFSLALFYETYFLSWHNIYNFGDQLAKGLAFLHSSGCGHEYLKSKNIFVTTPDLIIKIGDFGLTRVRLAKNEGDISMARWRAPETFTRDYQRVRGSIEAKKSADMFSYGVILWEMATRRKPFYEQPDSQIIKLLSNGSRQEIEASWPEHFKSLLSSLWDFLPSSRPTAEEIVKTFEAPEFQIVEARLAPVLLTGSLLKENERVGDDEIPSKVENGFLSEISVVKEKPIGQIVVKNVSSEDVNVAVNHWGIDDTTDSGWRIMTPGFMESWKRSDPRGFVMVVSRSTEEETYFVKVGTLIVITDSQVFMDAESINRIG